MCQILSNGLHIIIDITWSSPDEIMNIIEITNINYFHVDISIKSYISVLTKYLQVRQATDVVIIFQNERGNLWHSSIFLTFTNRFFTELNEGLYQLLQDSLLRVITFNGMNEQTAIKIQKLRPRPTYSAILATGENMLKIIEDVKKKSVYSYLIT